jgi:putative flavoprotein involved in K+ transport
LPQAPLSLDLAASGVRTVVWATGYRRSYPWLQVPVLDSEGEIMTQGCETPVPGLYALGLPFQRQRSSALIDGVGRDAEALSRSIVRHLGLNTRLAA